MTTITALPSPPSRDDPTNFATEADAFLGALPTFVTEANTVAGEVNTNATNAAASAVSAGASETAAVGAANYQGDYSAGTTYSIGQSVSYNDAVYVSKVNSNTGNTPDISPTQWYAIPKTVASFGSAPETTTTDKTLTSVSGGYQVVSSSATETVIITLPDATSLSESASRYVISNESYYPVLISNNSGSVIAAIEPYKVSHINLKDNSTADGQWESGSLRDSLYPLEHSVVINSTTSYMSCCKLTESKVMVCYIDNGDSEKGKAVIFDIGANGSITVGSVAQFTGSVLGPYIDVCALSATQCVVVYRDQTNTNTGYACVLDVTGSTITPATPVQFTTSTITHVSVCALDTGKALVCYTRTNLFAQVLSVSGSTLSTAVEYGSSESTSYGMRVKTVSSTAAVAGYDTGGNTRGMAMTITGTVVSFGTPVTISTNDWFSDFSIVNASKLFFTCKTTNSNQLSLHDVSLSGAVLTVDTTHNKEISTHAPNWGSAKNQLITLGVNRYVNLIVSNDTGHPDNQVVFNIVEHDGTSITEIPKHRFVSFDYHNGGYLPVSSEFVNAYSDFCELTAGRFFAIYRGLYKGLNSQNAVFGGVFEVTK